MENMISDIASRTGRAQGAASSCRPTCPRNLWELEREASQVTSSPDERRRLRSEARKIRRRWQADIGTCRLTTRQPPKPVPTRMLDSKGNWSADPRKWSETWLRHCENKYSRPDHLAPQSTLVKHLNEAVRTSDRGVPEWTWSVTLRARASLSKGKSTGRSAISAEVLQSLSAEALWSLHMLLKAHYEGDGRSPITWTQVRLFLLPELRQPKGWEEFRGICLLNVVSKLFMSGVLILMKDWAKAHLGSDWNDAPRFGFEANCKCEDLLMCLQSRDSMAAEWPRQHRIIVASTDIKQAFYFVTPHVIADCLEYWKCPESLTRSLVREIAGTTAEAVCPGLPHTAQFAMENSIRQGGVESPWCFNLFIRTTYHEQRGELTSWGTSVPLLGKVPMLGWADNILFLGDSVADVQRSLDAFTSGMHTKGMRWKPGSMQFMQVGRGATDTTT